jgi:hypothetical protein
MWEVPPGFRKVPKEENPYDRPRTIRTKSSQWSIPIPEL